MFNQQPIHQNIISKIIKKYIISQQLSQSSSSKVYLAIDQNTKQQFAIKVIPKSYLNTDKRLLQLLKTQIYLLKSCNNQNLIKYYEVFQTQKSVFLVMEYCNGINMQKYVKKKIYLNQDCAVWYLKQILNGFKGLHQFNAMHRDFKLQNLLLHNRVCKIADLGFAKRLNGEQLTNTILGTFNTMAPEVLEMKPYGTNADIWSLGVVFYQMLTGKDPYKGYNVDDLIKNIKNIDFSYLQGLRVSPQAKKFIKGCLTYDPNARIKWTEIYEHPLLNKNKIQLIYGISNSSQVFHKNQQFYRTQNLDDMKDSLYILQQNGKKQIVFQKIEQIQQQLAKSRIVYLDAKNQSENNAIIIRYSVNYGMYLNGLIYPMKLIDIQRTKTIPNVDHFTPIYLIYKKTYTQICQLNYIIKKCINIFKIQILWKQFLKSAAYSDIANIFLNYLQKAQKLYTRAKMNLEGNKSHLV